jgi:hypothetical protein
MNHSALRLDHCWPTNQGIAVSSLFGLLMVVCFKSDVERCFLRTAVSLGMYYSERDGVVVVKFEMNVFSCVSDERGSDMLWMSFMQMLFYSGEPSLPLSLAPLLASLLSLLLHSLGNWTYLRPISLASTPQRIKAI